MSFRQFQPSEIAKIPIFLHYIMQNTIFCSSKDAHTAHCLFTHTAVPRHGSKEPNDKHQYGLYASSAIGFTAIHSISTSQPGRQTGAWRYTLGIEGKRSSNISRTTA